MKILVTGGAGFLGTNLCRRLVKENHDITCLDNLYTGRKENIQDLIQLENFKFVKGDITRKIRLSEKYDWIFNLACPASPFAYQTDPLYTMKASVLGVLNIAEFALKTKAKLFHTSTSEVYGDPKETPQKETYRGNVNPIGIRACYDEGKRCAETILYDYNRLYGLVIKIVRIFNTYGPYMGHGDGRVITNFVTQALTNKPLTVYGDGSQTRSFCYVDDQIEAWMKFVKTSNAIKGPINIGMPEELKIVDVAKMIIKITGSKSRIEFKDLPSDDPKRRLPDIAIAKKELGWEPKVSLEEGILKTIEHLKKDLKLS